MYWKTQLLKALNTIKDFSVFFAHRAKNDTIFRVAASLSYTTLIAIVPLFAIGLSIFSAFPAFENVRGQVQELIISNLAPAIGKEVNTYLSDFLQASAGLTTIGVISIAVTSILMLSTIENSLNFIFRISKPRRFTTKITLYWTVITLGPLLLGAALSMRSYVFGLNSANNAESLTFDIYLSALLPVLCTMFLLIMVYVLVPNKKVGIINAAAGSLVAGILFSLLRKAFSMAILTSATYQTLYGALATIPIFLIWMYLSWSVVIFGAVVTAALEDYQLFDRRSLAKELILSNPQKRDFLKNHKNRKKLLQSEQK